jgi:peroxiredoxin
MAVAARLTDWARGLPRTPGLDWSAWRALLRYEFLISRRSKLGWGLLVICCGAGLVAGLGGGLGPSLAAYRAWRLGVLLVGFAALPLMAVAARLDALSLASDAVTSRPRSALDRLLARFVGSFLFVVVAYAVVIVAAWLAQLLLGGAPVGGGGRFSLGAPVHAFTAGLPALLYVSALAYCVTVLCPNLLSVAIVALYWLLILLGRDYLSRIFDFTLTQNALPYFLLTVGLMALTLQVTRWRARVGRLWSPTLAATAALLLVLGLVSAVSLVMNRHDPPFHPKPLAVAMAGQSIRNGFIPGFWLPDQRGRRTGLHDLGPGPVLVAFWSPARPDSVAALGHLQDLHRQYAGRGLQVVAICLADDWSVAGRFARERGLRFPMLTDTGCHWAEKLDTCAPLAEAYEVSDLPAVYLADPSRRVVTRWSGSPADGWEQVTAQLPALLTPAPGVVGPPG